MRAVVWWRPVRLGRSDPICGDFWEMVFSSGSDILTIELFYVLLGNPRYPG
ncbi:hypothetical protein DPMN_107272 [Dreissena polymorpha]|uniref:Uncharacterized protein n=1 Tax=Dreissena polymorpha TaxID=45954 RepID=A0A9D4QJS0_DREPO|nr:hypothetical protein DPMN_107272 [Dreissena polymorpha]